MNLEEAIKLLKQEPDFSLSYYKREYAIDLLLKAYEKQQKGIEELKHDNSILCEIAYTGKRIQLPYTMVYTGTDNFISKDKIRELIQEIESYAYTSLEEKEKQDYAIYELKRLLEE